MLEGMGSNPSNTTLAKEFLYNVVGPVIGDYRSCVAIRAVFRFRGVSGLAIG